MEHDITIRLELQLPAMKIMHHLQTHNEQVEGEIKKGVQLAIDEISNLPYLDFLSLYVLCAYFIAAIILKDY